MRSRNVWRILLCAALIGGCDDNEPADTASMGATSDPNGGSTTGGSTTDAATTLVTPTTSGELDTVECDPWLQDCPSGYKCMAYAQEGEQLFTGTKCTPVAENPGAAGEPCKVEGGWWTGVDDCGYGQACWNINQETNTGLCASLCTGSEDAYACPGTDEVCVFWVPGLAHVCLQRCDPLLQDCDAGQSCLPDWASNGQRFVCLAEYSFEQGQEFDPCEFSNVCDPGLVCWDPSKAVECDQTAAGCCLSFCDLSNPQCSGMGAVCESFYTAAGGEPPPAFADVGLCVIPG